VLDPKLARLSANRVRFMHQALADLRETIRGKGGDLVIRAGDPVAETIKLAREVNAEGVAVTRDVSRYAQRRHQRLQDECVKHRISLRLFPGVSVIDPGDVRPGGGDHYKVFTPYHRAWQAARWRDEVATPQTITLPDGVQAGRLPAPPAGDSPEAADGGETEGGRKLTTWLKNVGPYDDLHDDMAADRTSRLSPYLRFGCVSPLAVANAVRKLDGPGPEAFVRQLAWRDFYYQVTAAFPMISTEAYRKAGDADWHADTDALTHWQDGLTGCRSWTPACANSASRAGCTTAPG
jgi:deoxyribodipyrimidine photo-lyase